MSLVYISDHTQSLFWYVCLHHIKNCCCYDNRNSQNVALVGDLCVAGNTCACLFIVYYCSNRLWMFCVVSIFLIQYFPVLQSYCWGRDNWLLTFIVFWISCCCYCHLPRPHGAVDRSVMCECGIS